MTIFTILITIKVAVSWLCADASTVYLLERKYHTYIIYYIMTEKEVYNCSSQ